MTRWYLSVVVVLVLYVVVMSWLYYGVAKYDQGVADCQRQQADKVVINAMAAKKGIENVSRETLAMDDAAVDRDLRRLGIMRQPSDR